MININNNKKNFIIILSATPKTPFVNSIQNLAHDLFIYSHIKTDNHHPLILLIILLKLKFDTCIIKIQH